MEPSYGKKENNKFKKKCRATPPERRELHLTRRREHRLPAQPNLHLVAGSYLVFAFAGGLAEALDDVPLLPAAFRILI